MEKISLDLEEQKETESDITRILDIDEEFCVCYIDWQITLEQRRPKIVKYFNSLGCLMQ